MALTDFKIYQLKNSVLSSNTYVLAGSENNNCIIIDPGMDVSAIDQLIEDNQLHPTDIIATHGHFDHVGSVAFFQKKYHAKFHIHEFDVKALRSVNFFLKILKIDSKIAVPVPDHVFCGDIFKLQLNNFHIDIYNFPGHTAGSCILKIENCLFTGDTLYSKGVGINHFPGYDNKKLKSSLIEIFNLFDSGLTVYPGHGSSAKLGRIEMENAELKKFLALNSEV